MKKAIVILYILVLVLAGWLGYACYCNLSFNSDSSAGLLVSALGVMVTLLVAWQIYSTIEAERKISSLHSDLTTQHHYVDARIHFTQGQNLMLTTLSHLNQQKAHSSKKNTSKNNANQTVNPAFVGNLCVAYRNFLEALTHYLQSTKDAATINSCIANMETCLERLQKENVRFSKDIGDKCDILFETLLLMQLLTSPKLAERLNNLNKQRTGN